MAAWKDTQRAGSHTASEASGRGVTSHDPAARRPLSVSETCLVTSSSRCRVRPTAQTTARRRSEEDA